MNVGYIRVSTTDQNPERQLDGCELDKKFIDYCSGKNLERPKLKEALNFVREHDTLIVHSMDRLARTLVDLRSLVADLNKRNVKVKFIKENLIFSGEDTPLALLLLNIMGSFAEFERSLIKERQAEGIRIAKQKGIYTGRKKVFNKDQIKYVRDQAASGTPKASIAKHFKVSRETIYKYLRQDYTQ